MHSLSPTASETLICENYHTVATFITLLQKKAKSWREKGKKRTYIRTSHNFATFDERIHFEHGSALSSRRIWLRNKRMKRRKKPHIHNTQPPSRRSARSVLILFIFIFTHFVVNMWRLLVCIGSFYNAPRISSKWIFFFVVFFCLLLFYYMLYLSVYYCLIAVAAALAKYTCVNVLRAKRNDGRTGWKVNSCDSCSVGKIGLTQKRVCALQPQFFLSSYTRAKL